MVARPPCRRVDGRGVVIECVPRRVGQDVHVETSTADEHKVRRRSLRRALVWLSFVWLAVLAGFFVWACKTHNDAERQAPKLVAAVDDAMRSASSQNAGLLDKLVVTSRIQSMGEPGATDVFSVVPVVEGAEAFQFTVAPDGAVVVGYRGTSLANDVCVRSVLSPSGAVATQRWSCSAW